ncbi:WD40 repeat domain-containing protein [Pontibacter qinzhouensis]|uniref:WD40 repeat domain-containing protein n=1 Tax=Pontibacter qinzhouensis TaxID=2603253 RepID=A0A5C8KC54_9BACT|nr:WD40 repeat domain-containing protein [Pontibacter qinzhouensis]TXK49000.1 WD40 repeat domain-containing protein [Pontibacter qinzhouensis]
MATTIEVQKLHTLTGHRDCIYTLEPSGENHVVFSAGGDGMVAAWNLNDPENGELIARVTSSVYALSYVPFRNLLLIGQNNEGLQVIDLQNKAILKSVSLPKVAIFDIKYSALLNKVYVAQGNGGVCILAADTFELQTITRSTDQSARSLALNSHTQELAVGYSDNSIRIFDAATMQLKHELKNHTNSVFTVAYSPEGDLLITGGRDAHLRVWEVQQGYKERGYTIAHMYTINHIAYSPDGRHFATCSMDKSIKIWDARTFKLLKVIDKVRNASHGTSVNKLFWTAHHNQLVSCSDDRTISVWDIKLS